MVKLIYLSPSVQTANKYAAGNTTEAIQCRRIANACEKAFEASNLCWNDIKRM